MPSQASRSSGKRARFSPDQRRQSRIAKVHIAKKELQLDEDDYRQILFDETGQMSAGDCDERQLNALIARFEAKGWKSRPKKGGARRPAQHPMAKKARAMWISLHQLGVVKNPSEKALEAFAKRQLKCDRLEWAKQSHGGKLIEALKAMAERHHWKQSDEDGRHLSVRALKQGLCEAILKRMIEIDEVPVDWTIDIAAWRLCGIDTGANGPMNVEGYTDLAAALGRKLREALPAIESESA